MTKTLPKSRIIELIETWSALAPDVGIRSAARAIIQNIERTDIDVTTSDKAALFVRKVVEHFRELILPEYLEQLKQTDIYVVAEPLCNAGADRQPRQIVFFDGLFQVLTFRMELSLLIAEVNRHFDTIAGEVGLTRDGFPSTAYQAQLLSLHFLHHPEPLPTLSQYFDERLRNDAAIAFGGGLLFILLHELGHLELHHGATDHGSPLRPSPTLACLEDVNVRKGEEFEADAFAFNALVPRARSTVIVNVWYVMSLLLDYEALAGNVNNSHPLTINRVFNLNKLSGALEDPVIGKHAMKMFDSRLALMQFRLDAELPEDRLLAADVRAHINGEAYMKVLGTAEDSRNALAKLIDAYRLIASI